MRKSYREKKLIPFLLLFNDLKYCKNSLFCCNGYSHSILTFFYESQVEELKQAFTKKKSANDCFIAVLLLFNDRKNINSTKKRFSNKKLSMMPKVTLITNLKMNIVTKF